MRTEYGIPHVTADDWRGLGYGYGYAYAQDNFCIAMRAIVFATSRSAEFFGEQRGDLTADFVLRFLFGTKDEFRRNHLPPPDARARQLTEGFAAGMNRYLRDTGVGNLPAGDAGCRDADWVYEIDEVDIWMQTSRVVLDGSSDQSTVRRAIFEPTGPDGTRGNRSRRRRPGRPADCDARQRTSPDPGGRRQQRPGRRTGSQPDGTRASPRQSPSRLERRRRIPSTPSEDSRHLRRRRCGAARHPVGGNRFQPRSGVDPHHVLRRPVHALRTRAQSERSAGVPLRRRLAQDHRATT